MLIREMDIDDLDRIVSLERELFTSAWSKSDFLYEIFQNEFSYNFVLEDDKEIVGYIGLWIMYEQAQITTLGIDKRYQRKGLGLFLLERMITFVKEHGCESMSLEVRVSNEAAIRLYEKVGFSQVAIRKNYYQDNHEDAYLMMKSLEVEE